MRVLVTAGNTQTPVDRVRCLTNIFTGRTGGRLALAAYDRGHAVSLLTSHPQVIAELRPGFHPDPARWQLETYRTFDDLHTAMANAIGGGGSALDVVVHSAAVSDYALAGIYAPAVGVEFDTEALMWRGAEPPFVDAAAGKVRSSHPEVWLRLVPTPKLIDKIRHPWGFDGVLVKFKLEVGVGDAELAEIARASRRHSQADFLIANTLESYETGAIICDALDAIQHVPRAELPDALWSRIEKK